MPRYILFTGLLALFVLSGCGGNPPDAIVVAEPTIAPTLAATEPPTFTPEPTNTERPEPTAISSPTSTPTPEPTDTPLPTNTPEPTETATATFTPVPTVAPTAVSTSAPPAPATDASAVLREQLATAIAELNNYRWALLQDFPDRSGLYKPTAAVNCRSIITAHDNILSLFAIDVSASDATVQNARTVALEGVTQFNVAVGDWTDSCRQAMASGNETNILGRPKYLDMTKALAAPDHLWNQATRMLDD